MSLLLALHSSSTVFPTDDEDVAAAARTASMATTAETNYAFDERKSLTSSEIGKKGPAAAPPPSTSDKQQLSAEEREFSSTGRSFAVFSYEMLCSISTRSLYRPLSLPVSGWGPAPIPRNDGMCETWTRTGKSVAASEGCVWRSTDWRSEALLLIMD